MVSFVILLLQADPLDPAAGLALRRLLFEAPATVGTVRVVEQLLGQESLMQLKIEANETTSSSSGSSSSGGNRTQADSIRGFVQGWVPNLEHPAFQDIDLWG